MESAAAFSKHRNLHLDMFNKVFSQSNTGLETPPSDLSQDLTISTPDTPTSTIVGASAVKPLPPWLTRSKLGESHLWCS